MDKKPALRHILKEKFALTDEQWDECLEEHLTTSSSLVGILIKKNIIGEDALLRVLSQHLGYPYIKLKLEDIDSLTAKNIPAKFAAHYTFMPIRNKNGLLQVAVHDPLEIAHLDEIALFLNQRLDIFLANKNDILEAVKKLYGVGAETLEAITDSPAGKDIETTAPAKGKDIQDETIDPSVIKFLNQVLLDAITQRATDIHFEPFENDLRIRYRIDGILYEIACPPTIKHFQSSIASRIKVMANMDIAEKRKPQDGRIDIKMEGENYDLRVSSIPTPYGESIGIRILQRSNPVIGLESLGLDSQSLEVLEKTLTQPHGIILATGPTGNGKTTTLYACLNKINSPERKILTIEDPIEYQLKGITQMQVEAKTNFTFANALRSMLRHDPDIMMVGEIRDTETAELAVRTALTGHLVFSTLHTNDASGAIARLLDMNIDAFLVSSAVILIIAQRLLRLNCPACKERITPEPSLINSLSTAYDPARASLYRGRGCEACRFTGYKGRTGIFETLVISEPIRELILKKATSQQIKQTAISLGMKTLRESGWEKVCQGFTTIEEVLRVTHEEEKTKPAKNNVS